jgi:hypothetical protein
VFTIFCKICEKKQNIKCIEIHNGKQVFVLSCGHKQDLVVKDEKKK